MELSFRSILTKKIWSLITKMSKMMIMMKVLTTNEMMSMIMSQTEMTYQTALAVISPEIQSKCLKIVSSKNGLSCQTRSTLTPRWTLILRAITHSMISTTSTLRLWVLPGGKAVPSTAKWWTKNRSSSKYTMLINLLR